MKTALRISLLMIVGSFFCASSVQAQSSGIFGTRNLGGSVSGGSRSLTGTPGDRVEQAQADAGQVTGQERFLRDNRQPGQFVGADAGDSQNFLSQLGATGGGQGLSGLANRAASRGQNSNRSSANRAIPYRAKLTVGFAPHASVTAASVQKLTRRFENLAKQQRLDEITVAQEGSTVVLTGRVANVPDRDLAIQLAHLEPGVADVRSELVVASESLPLDSPQ